MLAWSAPKLTRSAAATAGPACAQAHRRHGIARSAVRDIGPDDIPSCADLGHWHESPPGGRVLRVGATHVPALVSAFDLLPIDGCRQRGGISLVCQLDLSAI